VIELTPPKPMRPRLSAARTAVLLSSALLTQAAVAQSAKPSLLQRIRALIGLNRPIAAGGSRSSAALAVCVITPRTELDVKGQAQALVPLPRPTILAASPLNEVRIDRGGQPVWRQRASSTQAIEGPISWPVEPIQPGEQLTLLLRPRGASGGDFARIQLTGASATEMISHQALVEQLGSDAKAWLKAVDIALDRNQVPLAWALLFAPQDPRSAELDELRREVLRRGCGE
jgi:hypothetical protein